MDLSVDASACVLRCHQQHGIALDIRWSIPRIRMNLEACCDFLSLEISYDECDAPMGATRSHKIFPMSSALHFEARKQRNWMRQAEFPSTFQFSSAKFFQGDTCAVLLTAHLGMTLAKWKQKNTSRQAVFAPTWMLVLYIKTYQDIIKTSRLAARPPNIRRHSFMSPRGGSASSTWKWVWCSWLDTHTLKIFKALDGWTCSR